MPDPVLPGEIPVFQSHSSSPMNLFLIVPCLRRLARNSMRFFLTIIWRVQIVTPFSFVHFGANCKSHPKKLNWISKRLNSRNKTKQMTFTELWWVACAALTYTNQVRSLVNYNPVHITYNIKDREQPIKRPVRSNSIGMSAQRRMEHRRESCQIN